MRSNRWRRLMGIIPILMLILSTFAHPATTSAQTVNPAVKAECKVNGQSIRPLDWAPDKGRFSMSGDCLNELKARGGTVFVEFQNLVNVVFNSSQGKARINGGDVPTGDNRKHVGTKSVELLYDANNAANGGDMWVEGNFFTGQTTTGQAAGTTTATSAVNAGMPATTGALQHDCMINGANRPMRFDGFSVIDMQPDVLTDVKFFGAGCLFASPNPVDVIFNSSQGEVWVNGNKVAAGNNQQHLGVTRLELRYAAGNASNGGNIIVRGLPQTAQTTTATTATTTATASANVSVVIADDITGWFPEHAQGSCTNQSALSVGLPYWSDKGRVDMSDGVHQKVLEWTDQGFVACHIQAGATYPIKLEAAGKLWDVGNTQHVYVTYLKGTPKNEVGIAASEVGYVPPDKPSTSRAGGHERLKVEFTNNPTGARTYARVVGSCEAGDPTTLEVKYTTGLPYYADRGGRLDNTGVIASLKEQVAKGYFVVCHAQNGPFFANVEATGAPEGRLLNPHEHVWIVWSPAAAQNEVGFAIQEKRR